VLRARRSNEDRIAGDPREVPPRPDYHRVFVSPKGDLPAPNSTLAFQIRELERDTSRALTLDAIVTVIDAENFSGYEDTSITARMQAQYTDVLLINKWEHVSERALDDVLEHLNTLNEYTPKIRCSGKSVDPALIFSIDSKLFRDPTLGPQQQIEGLELGKAKGDLITTQHHDEVETLTLLRGAPLPAHEHEHEHVQTTTPSDTHDHRHHHHPHPPSHPEEPKAAAAAAAAAAHPLSLSLLDESTLTAALSQLPKESVYRVKGFIRFSPPSPSPSTPPTPVAADADAESRPWWILNWAFGRWELVRAPSPSPVVDENDGDKHAVVRLTVMGERGEVRRYAERLAEALGTAVV